MKPKIGITCSTGDPPPVFATGRNLINVTYVEWVERCGGLPLVLPNTAPDLAAEYLDLLDGLLLSGGDDISPLLYGAEPDKNLGGIDVPRDRFELPLAREALRRRLPILGICRGIQTLNVAAGGTLRQDLVHDPAATVQHRMKTSGGWTIHHGIAVAPGSRLHRLIGLEQAAVNTYHHQAVDELADGFIASATAADGVIEAIELPGERFVLGVQWHPELMEPEAPITRALFEGFVAACREPASARC